MSLPGVEVDPGRGDPAGVRSVAAQFASRSSALTDRGASARSALAALGPLESEAVDALRPRIAALVDRFDRAAEAAASVSGILGDYADALDDIRARAATALANAHTAYEHVWVRRSEALNAASELVTGWALGWDDVLPAWLYVDDPGYLHRWSAAIEGFRDARSVLLAVQHDRDELDRATAARLRGVDLFAQLASSAGAGVAGRLAAASLWAGDLAGVTAEGLAALGDPDLVRRVWNAMTPEQRAALIAAAPLLIGNLDGIPIRDRVAANRLSIANEIHDREAAIAAIEEQKADALEKAYRGHDGIAAVYDGRIAEEQAVIDYYRSLLTQRVEWIDEDRATRIDVGARVVVFDPRSDAIATYHGPLDPQTGDIPSWVRHVTVSVPGTEARMTGFSDERGLDLYHAAGRESAVFQWAGGRFPQHLVEATDSSYANALAPKLRDFAAGIAVPDGGTLTVLGHSYGGATVGLAEKAGLSADRVLYVAAAGMGHGVGGLEDFPNTGDVPHYALMSRNDAIVGLVQGNDAGDLHGRSPLTADGVVRLETGFVTAGDASSGGLEDYNVPGNGTPAFIDSHSTVFHVGSGSFANIVAVITGGTAEVFAPDQVIVAGRSVVVVDGIDRNGYVPHYETIE